MKYNVTYKYGGKVVVEVEADSEREAESKGLKEADFYIGGALIVDDVTIRKIEE